MAGGSRVVPIDYRLNKKEFEKELSQLNGVYIPGDTKGSFLDADYVFAVGEILGWSHNHQ